MEEGLADVVAVEVHHHFWEIWQQGGNDLPEVVRRGFRNPLLQDLASRLGQRVEIQTVWGVD